MRKILIGLITVLLTVVMSVTASAQGTRHGWYASGGIAYSGYNWSGPETLPSDFKNTISWNGEVGFTLRPALRLGAEVDYYTKTFSGEKLTATFYNVAMAWYPGATSDFFAKVMLGYANTALSGGAGSQGGLSTGVGVGYDWLIGKGGFALIPFASYNYQLSGGEFPIAPGEKFKSSLLQVGVGIGFRH